MNIKLFCVAIIIFLHSSFTFAKWENKLFDFGGYTREYRVYLPEDFSISKSYSLVVGIHGLGDNMTNFSNSLSDFCRIADTADIILVYPQGVDNFLIGTGWNSGAGVLGIYPSERVDDVAFINALTDFTQEIYPIIKDQTYLFGFSNGGFMVQRIACEANERFAAIASIAGTLGDKITQCHPERAVPIVHFHGTADINVNYTNPPMGRSVPSLMKLWKQNYGCDDQAEIINLPNIKPDGYTVDHLIFKNCIEKLELFKINNAMHVLLNKANNDISYSEEMWKFFRPQKVITGVQVREKESLLNVFPIPAQDVINIRLLSENYQNTEVSIWDYTGKQIAQLKDTSNGVYQLDCSHLSNGLYLVKAINGNQIYRSIFTIVR